MGNFDFSGWATKANLKCSDGRTIMKGAFKHMDGQKVPLCWGHVHNDPEKVLGHALLEDREEGVYAHCKFNDTPNGQTAKKLVEHGDVVALSIYANGLVEKLSHVTHGNIREVSLVLAGANPGAFIENVMLAHGDEMIECESEARIYTGEPLYLEHSDDYDVNDEEPVDDGDEDETLEHADKEDSMKKEENKSDNKSDNKTFKDVIDTMNEEQKTVLYALVGQAIEDTNSSDDDDENDVKHSEGGDNTMKHNVFENDAQVNKNTLSHADQMDIVALAKQANVGSLKHAMEIYAEENSLSHGVFENYEVLFPEYELLKKGEPETLYKYDQSWVAAALSKISKSPFSRIRTRQADARAAELKAKGYQKKGDKKTLMDQITMIQRTTDPQTIYIKDEMHRDDIIDVTDFDTVAYQWKQMRQALNETLVLAALIGDGRELDDPDKIKEVHVRPIWSDEELYTIHADLDLEAAKKELQGTNTGANFGDNYIYAEAMITAALYAREKFKGTGTPDFYCTPHSVNRMLLARDMNGRRIYDSKADLAKALNVNSIIEVEQFEGRTRTDSKGATKNLVGLFVNLADYQFGSTKGGEITKFEDFDMDFNKEKFMLETRLSGALTKVFSAIALEEPAETDAEG